jgi:MFS family permease
MINVTAVAFLALLDTSIISTAIPSITDDFKSLPDIGWYGSAYQLSSAALQPLTGKIYTKLSLKWSFLAFLCLFELGSLLCGVASSSKMLIIARAIAGMGGAGLMNGAITIISSCVPLSKRATLTGILMGISQLGVVCGPLLGGALTQYSTWRWVFLINLPIGAVVAAILCFVRIPDQVKKESTKSVLLHLHHHLDFVGFMLVAPAAVQLLLAVQYGGNDFAWNSSTVIGLFCGSGATFAVWYAWNWYRGDAALIPLSIASQRVVWCSSITQMGLMTTLYVTNFFLSVYFQAILGANAMMSGVYLLGTILSQLVFTILSGVFGM